MHRANVRNHFRLLNEDETRFFKYFSFLNLEKFQVNYNLRQISPYDELNHRVINTTSIGCLLKAPWDRKSQIYVVTYIEGIMVSVFRISIDPEVRRDCEDLVEFNRDSSERERRVILDHVYARYSRSNS